MTKVDFDDMQGLVRFGHGRLVEAEFLLLKVADRNAARAWLFDAPIASAATQSTLPDSALQIAFSAEGLRAFDLSDDIVAQFSQPFLSGMGAENSRSRRLGDTGTNDPEGWRWKEADAHILLMLYGERDGLEAFRASIKDARFHKAFETVQSLQTQPNSGVEPFGFADGISEPKIDWEQSRPPSKHGRETYSNLIAPGEVILGHPNEYDEISPSPSVETDGGFENADRHDLGANGTYLVLRQLQQDVPGFWQFLDLATEGDAERRENLAAKMVGRHRDGTPLMNNRCDISGGRPANNFTYDDDINGVVCPLGAHIRRANPRTGDIPPGNNGILRWLLSTLGFRRRPDKLPGRHDLVASTRFHRLVRRGRAYGPQLSPEEAISKGSDEERGLFFICLCADIVRQFEFVQNAWMASGRFDGLTGEADPLLGNRAPIGGAATGGFTIQTARGVPEHHANLPQFVTVKGGGYFFMPGLKALRYIATTAS
ncbi:Dyp-type peroxidase [Litoreibacter arenae]|uniref:Peroxidase n=1 Tax=Litoreibacter arenae DSM 19593 TaxID=1123360 RepID=S9Q714_9RHOB|nr:peroxidase [Litoreibacter arenae]EPX77146.1 Peroxidase [Litoreibacter arenae DSM 19593]